MRLKNALYTLTLVAFATVAVTGCKKSAFDINDNPNQPTDSTITYNLILPAALQSTAYVVETNWGWLQNWLGFWARSGTYAPNVMEETYSITTNFQTGLWDALYSNAFNYQIMQVKAEQAGATYYQGIARMMKAHNFQILVDVYGNVPYFGALKGNANTTPAYDKGIDIYKDLFRQIDTAIGLIKQNYDGFESINVDYEQNDLVYGGDRNLWAKFGNTLKLRMLMHVYNVPGFDIAGEVAKITTEGSGYLASGESAEINPGFSATKPNPFYRTYVNDESSTATGNSVYYKANEYAIGYYNYNGDPRLPRFYAPGNAGQRGVAYGLPPVSTNVAATLSSISGPGLMKDHGYDAPAWILTSVESYFLQSEAAERGIIPGDGETLWEQGVIESFVFLGLTATQGQNFITANAGSGYPDVDYVADPIYAIISQKWFSLNAIAPFEIWSDYRRVDWNGEDHFVYGEDAGFDPGPPISVAPANSATEIPIRLLYPQNEYNYNSANVGAEGTIDQFNSNVFWDVN